MSEKRSIGDFSLDEIKQFDTALFEQALYRECRTAFSRIIDDHKDSGIYLIGLYHSGGGAWSYLSPIVHTAKGLNQAITEAMISPYQERQTEAEIRRDLIWSSCDSPSHCSYESILDESEVLMQKLSEQAGAVYDEVEDPGDVSVLDSFDKVMREAICRVLNTLGTEDIYTPLGNRNEFIVALVCGDESIRDKLEMAVKLNPEACLSELREDADFFEEMSKRTMAEAYAVMENRGKN